MNNIIEIEKRKMSKQMFLELNDRLINPLFAIRLYAEKLNLNEMNPSERRLICENILSVVDQAERFINVELSKFVKE